MPEVRMTMEEYLAIVGNNHTVNVTESVSEKKSPGRSKKRGSTAASRKLSKALKVVYKKARKKNGDYKKGWTQARVMKEAHRMVK